MNVTMLSGNVTKDATINVVSDKQDAVNFSLATNRSYKDKEGNWQNIVQYHNCTRFLPTGKGEKLVAQLTKGRGISLEGALRTSPKKAGGKDGKSYVNSFIVVEELEFGAKPAEKAAAEA